MTSKPTTQKPLSFTVPEIAEQLNVSEKTVRFWVDSGKLPSFKYPGKGEQAIVRIRKDVLDSFMKIHSTRATLPPETGAL